MPLPHAAEAQSQGPDQSMYMYQQGTAASHCKEGPRGRTVFSGFRFRRAGRDHACVHCASHLRRRWPTRAAEHNATACRAADDLGVEETRWAACSVLLFASAPGRAGAGQGGHACARPSRPDSPRPSPGMGTVQLAIASSAPCLVHGHAGDGYARSRSRSRVSSGRARGAGYVSRPGADLPAVCGRVAPGRHRRTARLVVLSYGITGPLIVPTFFLSCVEDVWSGVRRADASMAQFEILRLAHRTGEQLVHTFIAHGDSLWAHSSLVFSELRLHLEIEIR